jgi:hypothetical protein
MRAFVAFPVSPEVPAFATRMQRTLQAHSPRSIHLDKVVLDQSQTLPQAPSTPRTSRSNWQGQTGGAKVTPPKAGAFFDLPDRDGRLPLSKHHNPQAPGVIG